MRIKVLAVVAAVTLGAVALAAAQSGARAGRGMGVNPAVLQSELGLSDEQAAQIRRLVTDARKAEIRRRADMQIARIELEDMLSAPTVDEAAIAAHAKALGDMEAATLRARIESRLAVRRVLTAEQYQKMQQLKHRAVRAREGRPGRRPGRGDFDGPESGASSHPGVDDDVRVPAEPGQ
jgi:Spy/CpxP family protein refolding chaperone